MPAAKRRFLSTLSASSSPLGSPGTSASRGFRHKLKDLGRLLIVTGAVAWASSSCEEFDTQRKESFKATFGDDLYGVLCDRAGADWLQEDLTGASYQSICHYDESGEYGDEVDTSVLPEPSGEAAIEARRVSVAKMGALVRRRSELVRAFNAAFPDEEIDDPSTEDPNDKINLLSALLDFSQRLSILYEVNPYDTSYPPTPLAPKATQAMGNLFDAISVSDDARGMLTRMWARRGYRPSTVGLGMMGAALSYPDLRELTSTAITLLGPLGAGQAELKRVLDVIKQKMAFMTPEVSGLPVLSNAGPGQLNRPRTTVELVRDLMLAQDDRFAPAASDPPRYIALRDRRGYVLPVTLSGPFADADGDGLADVDGFGRFVNGQGEVAAVDTPFRIPGDTALGGFDEFGRSADTRYQYVDTSRTPAASLSTVLTPLLDATEYADPEDPNAFQSEYETLMYLLAGANVLLGPREDAEYDYETGSVVPLGTDCPSCVEYSRFRGEDSPLVDLAYAAGQILGDRDSDAMLLGLIDLVENHEAELARLIAAALRVKEIASEHDELAAKGQILPASLPYENTVWDEAAQALSKIAGQPRLMTHLLRALADPVVVTPIEGSTHMGDVLALYASTTDEMSYDPNNLNGPARNLSDGGSSIADPHHPVDVNAPRTGKNRSLLEKSVQLIYDASRAHTCNKDGAEVNASLFGVEVVWPLFSDPYGRCELFQIDDLAAFFFDSVIPPEHPKRAEFKLKDNVLNDLMDFFGFAASPDDMFEESSGITGMTTHPSSSALMRLVYFGASSDAYPNMPDHDAQNQGGTTDTFISGLMEPAATSQCGTSVLCTDQDDTLRLRTRNTMFSWERRGFLDYMRPVITAFADVACSEDETICDAEDISGERMFLELAESFWRHYPGPDHGPECDSSVPENDVRYCSGAGINRYEPIIEKAMRTDIIPALHEFAVAVHDLSEITIARGPRAGEKMTGAEVMELTSKILLSQDYSAQAGLKDRKGNKTALWTDGKTIQQQVTPFNIFADAFHAIDVAFSKAEDGELRQAQWRRARSQLVDVLLATEGSGANTRFKIRGVTPLLSTVLKLVREQLNSHCPTRESGVQCVWAREELAKNLADAISSPLTAAAVDMGEKVRQEPKARRALERFLTYLLQNVGEGTALQGTLASMVDVMQVLADDEKLVPIMRAASVALEPDKGAADTTLGVLKALASDDYDKYHVMDHVLANLVKPMPDADGNPGLSPLETFMEVIAEVHRADPTNPAAPLDAQDYQYIMNVMREFMLNDTRGLEQIYAIVRKRKKP